MKSLLGSLILLAAFSQSLLVTEYICHGNEPFWSLKITSSSISNYALFNRMGTSKEIINFNEVNLSQNNPNVIYFLSRNESGISSSR